MIIINMPVCVASVGAGSRSTGMTGPWMTHSQPRPAHCFRLLAVIVDPSSEGAVPCHLPFLFQYPHSRFQDSTLYATRTFQSCPQDFRSGTLCVRPLVAGGGFAVGLDVAWLAPTSGWVARGGALALRGGVVRHWFPEFVSVTSCNNGLAMENAQWMLRIA